MAELGSYKYFSGSEEVGKGHFLSSLYNGTFPLLTRVENCCFLISTFQLCPVPISQRISLDLIFNE